MDIIRIPTHYTMQVCYMNESDKSYIFETLMRLSIGEQINIEKSMRGGIVLSIWTEAVQLENKANAKKGKSVRIDIAPMVQPMVQQEKENDAPKSNQINSSQSNSNHIVSKETTDLKKSDTGIVKKEKNPEIDNLIQELKTQADILGIAYDKKDERNFARHILTAKEFGNFCEKIGQERIEFAKNIMIASEKIRFWRGVCAGPMMIYQNYAEVYNLTKTKSEASKIVKIDVLDW